MGAAVVALVGGALTVVALQDDEQDTNVAVVAPSSTTTTTELPVTTTTVEVTTTTLPAVTVPTTRPRPATTTTARPATTTTSAKPATSGSASPLEPGTQPWGYGDLGASRSVTQGRTRVVGAIYMRDLYKDEPMQTFAEVYDEGVVTGVRVDFGDGTSWEAGGHRTCDPASAPYAKPNPGHYQAPRHEYGPSGDYRVTISVTTVSCREWEATHTAVDEHTVHVTLTAHRYADRCRPSPDCPG